jgi:hypothetical protein
LNVRLTEGQQHALCGLLDHKQQAICSDPESGFFARTLAARYEAMRINIGGRRPRRNMITVTLTKQDGQSLDALLEHEVRTHGNEHYAAALAAIRTSRQPKADPRRVNGRRVRVAS